MQAAPYNELSRPQDRRERRVITIGCLVVLIVMAGGIAFCYVRTSQLIDAISWTPEEMTAFIETEGESARRAVWDYRKEHGKYPTTMGETGYPHSKKFHWWISGGENESGEVLIYYKLNWDEGLLGVFESEDREPGWYFNAESGVYFVSPFSATLKDADGMTVDPIYKEVAGN